MLINLTGAELAQILYALHRAENGPPALLRKLHHASATRVECVHIARAALGGYFGDAQGFRDMEEPQRRAAVTAVENLVEAP